MDVVEYAKRMLDMDEFKEYFSRQYNKMQNKTKKVREFLFEGDEKLKEHTKGSKSSTKLHLDLLPQPFIGDLENAKIIICSLNPGYSEKDECIEIEYQEEFRKQLDPDQQDKTLFWLTGDENDGGGFKWWKNKLDQKNKNDSFVGKIIREYKNNNIELSKPEVFNMLSKIMAAIELFPYHSKSFNENLLKYCNSTEIIKNYVLDVLIETAKKDKKLICFTRSFRLWGVADIARKKLYKDQNIICSPNPRSVTFNANLDFGKAIIAYLCKCTGGFQKIYDDKTNEFVLPEYL